MNVMSLFVTLIGTFIADSAFPGGNARTLFCPLLADKCKRLVLLWNFWQKYDLFSDTFLFLFSVNTSEPTN